MNSGIEAVAATDAKKNLRRQMLARRDALTKEERARASLLMTERILGHQWFYRSEYFLGFVSYGSEIDTKPLLEEAIRQGKKVYVPKVEGEQMVFYRICSLEELIKGYKGIPEPVGDTEIFDYAVCQKKGETDKVLLLMPGVAFDPYRNRIGYGKGFYDRYLAEREELTLRSIAVGFRCQMVDEVPAESYDKRPYQVICV
ncbi:MAG: 5-formyltetrahydrofolate cyclo-ligase [Acetatifactor sp.]|nr:5-formyltetrahydrofolate cyclo-ligase [Acetatifactor sp.]